MKKIRMLGLIAGLLGACVIAAKASQVVASTTTYNGAGIGGFSATALNQSGAYTYALSATGSFTGLVVYMQQVGLSGANYTMVNSTFSTCNAACNQTIVPDIYNGGNVRAQWAVTTGSPTFTVTANLIQP